MSDQIQAVQASDTHAETRPPRRYVPALDGLRAICAFAVIFYHMGLPWCHGGLNGVTVFFVLSGYLAMGSLLREYFTTGTIKVFSYYRRRIKRLMPTAVAYTIAAAAACTLFSHVLLTKMRPDIAPALLMGLNWYKIFSSQSYFAAAGLPSPLTHFWSLAIEFQFYLLLAPILLLLLKIKTPRKLLGVLFSVGAIASAIAMAMMFVPGADPSRAYYGTDTRAQSLLIGCVLALAWPFRKRASAKLSDLSRGQRTFCRVAGLGGIAALVWMMAFTEGYSSFSYYGGTFACSLIAALAIAALVPEGTVVSRILGCRPLAWIGKRSFAIYIWHYIVVELMWPKNPVSGLAWWQVLVELAVILVLSELSYRLIELPFERHSLREIVAHLVLGRPWPETGMPKHASRPIRTARQRAGHAAGLAGTAAALVLTGVAAFGLAFVPPVNAMGGQGDAHQVSAATLKKPLVDGVYDVAIFGDSVSLGAAEQLNAAFPHGLLDSAVSRQAEAALDEFKKYDEKGEIGSTVIFSVGTNGPLTEDMLQRIYDAVGPDRELWFINNRMPNDWCHANNELLASFAASHKNVGVIDWFDASNGHPEWFWDDATHLRPQYAKNFADLVANTIGYEAPNEENTVYSVIFLGESQGMQAAEQLSKAWPQGMVDCAAGRTLDGLASAWEGYVQAGTAGSRLVVAVPGTDTLTKDEIASFLDRIGDAVEVWLINTEGTAEYVTATNDAVSEAAEGRSNVHVIDWHAASAGHADWFAEDGRALTDAGIEGYVKTVTDAVDLDGSAGKASE